MNLKHYYWYFKKAIPSRVCDEIIKYGNLKREEIGLTGTQTKKIEQANKIKVKKKIKRTSKDAKKILNKKDIDDLKQKRDSNIAWLTEDWIYKEILPYVHSANKNANWNFDWDWTESCQFTKYKLNQFYDWHCDSWDEPYNNPNNLNFHNKTRKLSVTCSLSDPKDYKGGELEFQFRNQDDPTITKKCLEILPKGSIVVFPSYIWHRVKPVTKGTRYSLVMWNLGYPFK